MKKVVALLLLLIVQRTYAQEYCWDNSSYTDTYLASVSTDHTTFPSGSVFMISNDLEVIKTDTLSMYNSVSEDSLYYDGWCALVVSQLNCVTNELSFTLAEDDSLIVDNDTLPTASTGNYFSSGTYAVNYSPEGQYVITGEFDTIRIRGENQILTSVCVKECVEGPQLCMDFSDYDMGYLSSVDSDHTTYPIGDTIVNYGYYNFVKVDSFTTFSDLSDSEICFDDELLLDVGEFPYDCKVIEFNLFPPKGLIVDGDTIYSSSDPPENYNGTDFEFEYSGSAHHLIRGNIDQVYVFGGDLCWEDICVYECHYTPNACINFSLYDSTFLNAVNTDLSAYPVGARIMEAGHLEVFKWDATTTFDYTTPDSLCFSGDIGIRVATAPYPCRTVKMELSGADGITVDGENVFDMTTPPMTYSGSGFDFTYDGVNQFSIDGSFDTIQLYGSACCIQSMCLEECGFKTSECLDLSSWDDAYLADVTTDDITYPVGNAFITDGYIRLIKSSTSATYNLISGDSLSYSGDIILDVSLAPYTQRRLDFRLATGSNVSVDGETIGIGFVSPGTYSNENWTMEVNTEDEFSIWGSFDQLLLEGPSTYIDNVCLYEYSTIGFSDNEKWSPKIYPNPTTDFLKIESGRSCFVELLTSTGQAVISRNIESEEIIDLSAYPAGLYLLRLSDMSGTIYVERIVIR